jgi:hypothetical protein
MPIVVGDIITASSYNSLQSSVYNVLGAGSGQSGYGNTLQSSPVSVGDDILPTQWANLRTDVLTAAAHQGTTGLSDIQNLPIAGQDPDFYVSQDDYSHFSLGIAAITSNSFALGNGQYSDESLLTPQGALVTNSRTTNWGGASRTTISHNFTISFPSAAQARYFFNSGSSLKLSASFVGNTNSSQHRSWNRLLSNIGTVTFNHATTGANSGTGSSIGFYNLTNTPQTVFRASGSGNYEVAAYSSNDYVVKVSSNVSNNFLGGATQIFVSIDFNDIHSGPSDVVSGTLTSNVSIRRASGSNVNVAAPTAINTLLLSDGEPSVGVQVNYPATAVQGTPFTWSISNAIGNDSWYATTDQGSRFPVSGTLSVGANGSALYTDGTWGATTGTIVVTIHFSLSGNVTKTIIVSAALPTYLVATYLPNTNTPMSAVNETTSNSVQFKITTTNIPNSTTLYWTISGTNVTSSDFIDGSSTGTVVINSNTGSVTKTMFADNLTEGDETAIFQLRTESTSGTVVGTASILIQDTSQLRPGIVVTYPSYARSPAAGGTAFTWSISGGFPNETWYSTSNAPTKLRIPPTGTFQLDQLGAATYNTGDWGTNYGVINVDWYFSQSSSVSKSITNLPAITVNYPTTAIRGTLYSWSISNGFPNETYYITTTATGYSRIPSNSYLTLDNTGSASFSDGTFGSQTGAIILTFNFTLSGTVTKTITVSPASFVLTYPTTAVQGVPFTWTVTGGQPNETWYATSVGGAARIPSSGNWPVPLGADGAAIYANGNWEQYVGTIIVTFRFAQSGTHTRTIVVSPATFTVDYPPQVTLGIPFTWRIIGGQPGETWFAQIKNSGGGLVKRVPLIGVWSPPLASNGAATYTTDPADLGATGNITIDYHFDYHGIVTKAVNVITAFVVTYPPTVTQGIPFTWSVVGGSPNETWYAEIIDTATESQISRKPSSGTWPVPLDNNGTATYSGGDLGSTFGTLLVRLHFTSHGIVEKTVINNPPFAISYPEKTVEGIPFTWTVTGGQPYESWYATTTGATTVRVPATGKWPVALDSSGSQTYTNGAWGNVYGQINITFYFDNHSPVVKTVINSAAITVDYPSTAVQGVPFTWSVSGGQPGETWYATTIGGPARIPDTGNWPVALDETGAQTYTNGSFGSYTGTIVVTFNFDYHLGVTKTINITPAFSVDYPSTATINVPFTWSVVGGKPNEQWYSEIKNAGGALLYRIPASGNWPVALDNSGARTYSNGTLTTLGALTVKIYFLGGSGTVTKTINVASVITVSYPSTAIQGTPFSWNVSGGQPGDTWYATTIGGPARIPDTGTWPVALDGSGNAFYSGADFGVYTGTITVEFHFTASGTVTKTITITPTFNISYITDAYQGVPFTWSVSGGKANETWYADIKNIAGTQLARIPSSGYEYLDGNGALIKTDGSFGTNFGSLVVYFHFSDHGVITKQVNSWRAVTISYPTETANGVPFSWTVSGGKPGESWYADVKNSSGVLLYRLPASGNWPETLNSNGENTYTGGDLGEYYGVLTLEYHFTGHPGIVTKTVTNSPRPITINYPASAIHTVPFSWSASGGQPNETWYSLIKNSSGTVVARVPSSGTFSLNNNGEYSSAEGDLGTSYGALTVEFYFSSHPNTVIKSITNSPPTILVNYPSNTVHGIPFSWNITGGQSGETWFSYVKTSGGSLISRIPSSGFNTLSAGGTASYSNGDLGTNYGNLIVEFNFTISGTVTKLVSSEPPPITVNYPTTAVHGTPFSYTITGGQPGETWSADIKNSGGSLLYTVGPETLNGSGSASFSNGDLGTNYGNLTVTFSFQYHSATIIKAITNSAPPISISYPTTAVHGVPFSYTITGGKPSEQWYAEVRNDSGTLLYRIPTSGNWPVALNGSGSATETGADLGTYYGVLTVSWTFSNGSGTVTKTITNSPHPLEVSYPSTATIGTPFTWSVAYGDAYETWYCYIKNSSNQTIATVPSSGTFALDQYGSAIYTTNPSDLIETGVLTIEYHFSNHLTPIIKTITVS